ncbi:ABC transporter permease [Scandinavium goeteborgense]|jgi:peptide/nickel transport system permease protein|uniref:ABC transporter permease n=1 Tax=Scandinavium goeteborgense TaxID=1851514 RepID=UPI002165D383|nr:ABC transporter permease [Scandinavium goeteborgense]MCS2154975.1 ABC transporter permease [Scandinavium goeteborgense]
MSMILLAPGGRARRFSKRVSQVLVTLFGLLLLTFFIGRVMPIDPVLAIVGPDADQSTYQQVYHQLGFDKSLATQFWIYLGGLLHGDLGNALLTGKPVVDDILRVFPATLELATVAIIVGAGLGIPLGVWAAARRNSVVDYGVRIISLAGYSTPIFWVGMMGLLLFYAWLGWVGGAGRIDLGLDGVVPRRSGLLLVDALLAGNSAVFFNALNHLILPASLLGFHSLAYISRMTRSFMLAQLSQEFIITARVKGLTERQVIWNHAFRNILVQLLTVVALAYGSLLEGAVLIETVFSWPGFGSYLTGSLLLGDMNAVMGCVLVVGVIFVLLNLLSDMLYQLFDPRTKS